MVRFGFLLPFCYALTMSLLMIKFEVLHLGMNLITWSLYFGNILVVYILSKLGGLIDKCLDCLFS